MRKNKIVIIAKVLFLCFAVQLSYGQGSKYVGTYKYSPPLEYVRKNNLVIEGLEFSGPDASVFEGRSLTLWKCENVIIRNCKFKNVRWNVAIYIENSLNVTITDCEFENVYLALKMENCRGNVKFEGNDVKNLVMGLHNNRGGGGVQIANSNGPGFSVSHNVFESLPEETYTIDVIGTYKSNGTPENPITIRNNWIRGGGPLQNSGGIILGDFGGSHQIAEDNLLVDPGQYGIAIAGGHDLTLRNNKVYGRKQPFSNVGLFLVNWTEQETGPSYNITVGNNAINYISMNGDYGTGWVSENMKDAVPNWRQALVRDPSVQPSILPEQIIGRARMSVEPEPEPDPDEKPDDIVLDPSISIYKDTFDRICANCKGSISSSASLSVLNQNGQKILSIPIIGYHTTIDNPIPSGTYTVMVENDARLQIKKIVIN